MAAGQRILVVEDDKHISRLIKYNLEKAGYDCLSSITGEDALQVLEGEPVDLVLLDIMLPKMDGFEVCRQIRQDRELKDTPVIMLTAKGEEIDRVLGLELGADDYIVKPFSVRELVLRVKAILKRGAPAEKEKTVISSGPVVVDVPRHKVTVNGKEVKLTAMEFKLLSILMERNGRVQSRDRLLSDVWGIEAEIYTRTVDTHIKRLREKLGKAGRLIETVVGVGYRFKIEENED
ncbi:MAG: response regulator transcription factor [Candidatus Omnitrophota bacterium]